MIIIYTNDYGCIKLVNKTPVLIINAKHADWANSIAKIQLSNITDKHDIESYLPCNVMLHSGETRLAEVTFQGRPELKALFDCYRNKLSEQNVSLFGPRTIEDQFNSLVATMPENSVLIEARYKGEANGFSVYTYSINGHDLSLHDVVMLGVINSGTTDKPAPIVVACVDRDVLQRSISKKELLSKLRTDESEKAKKISIPAAVMKLFKKYGTAESAWNQGDDAAWGLMNRWETTLHIKNQALSGLW